VIVPKWQHLAYWAGETASFEVSIAHGAGPALEGAQLHMRLGTETRRMPLPRIEAPSVLALGSVDLPVPDADEACLRRVHFELRRSDGSLLAVNDLDMAVHPSRAAPALGQERVWSPSREILASMRALGYETASRLEDATLVVSKAHNEGIAAHVRSGASLLLLPEAEGTLYPFFPHWQNVQVKEREDTLWAGDWASSFAWLRRSGPFGRMPSGPLLDETFDRVIPTHVIAGCNLLDFQARVFAGLVVGWIHKPVALGVERSYGRGRIVASTFRLFRDAPLADPTATVLLDGLVEFATASRLRQVDDLGRAAEAAA
jgi:hypothetical protein